MDLIIRKMKDSEGKLWFDIQEEQFKEDMNRFQSDYSSFKKIIFLNRLLFGLPRKILAQGQNFYFFKRFDTKEVVGTSQVTFYDENSKLYINAFAVRPGLENQGFGTKMMNTLISQFPNRDFRLHVRLNNSNAIRLYNKFDFVEIDCYESFLLKFPINNLEVPNGYSFRLAKKDDFQNLERIKNEVPDMNDLEESYKNSINKYKKSKFRLQYQLPCVAVKNQEIIGIGRATWSKFQKRAQFISSGFIAEDAPAYPSFIGFIGDQLITLGISEGHWNSFKGHRPFLEVMKSFLGNSDVKMIEMYRKNQET